LRLRGRVDANQKEIVQALRQAGATVYVTSNLGGGFPDIALSFRDRRTGEPRTVLAEIKDGSKRPSARKLTPDEQAFHDSWQDEIAVLESVEDALALLGLVRRRE